MKHITEIICEQSTVSGLKPEFLFNDKQAIETIMDAEQQKFLTASYNRTGDVIRVDIYYKNKQIGCIKRTKRD